MPVTVSSTPIDGSYRVYGIARDPSASALLGRQYFHVGAHWIGFDDNFAEPVIVRAFFDPSQDATTRGTKGLAYVGYMQFMRLSFRGMPIPPSVYGGVLAQRQGYVYGETQEMVDFMDPLAASIRNIPEPLYPWNGMLATNAINSVDTLFYQPLPNGSLCSVGSLGSQQATAASLFAEITASMVTEDIVEGAVSDDNILVTIPSTSSQLATTEPYRIALDWLETNPLPGSPTGTPAFLADLDETQVAAQVVGDYVLLTMPDPEDLGDTLIISVEGTSVVVHLLSEYDFVAMSTDAARNALWRIKEYQLGLDEMDLGDGVDGPPSGRGVSGLTTPPYTLSAADFSLELKYWTAAVGVRTTKDTRGNPRLTMLSCLEWASLFQYDEDTGLMSLAAIRQPKLNTSFDPRPGLAQYIKARDAASEDEDGVVSISNFTKAAMARENFAAGDKIRFVSSSATAI
jgi:hypothetical protein